MPFVAHAQPRSKSCAKLGRRLQYAVDPTGGFDGAPATGVAE